MGVLIIILALIFLGIFFIKIFFPLLSFFSENISNTFLKKFISAIGILTMIILFIFAPYYIIKNIPKTEEQIKTEKYNKFRSLATKSQNDNAYDSAIIYYDSAKIYSNNSDEFEFEKSELYYMKGNSKEAINIINKLINSKERIGSLESYLYESLSMFYFSIYDYNNSIKNLKTAILYDSLPSNDWYLQISMMYILNNQIDSSYTFLVKAENNIDLVNNDDNEEFLKEINLIKSIFFFKKNDLSSACSHFSQFQKYDEIPIYLNYGMILFDRRFDSGEKLYNELFKSELNALVGKCKN